MDCNGKLGLDVVCAGVDARIAAGCAPVQAAEGRLRPVGLPALSGGAGVPPGDHPPHDGGDGSAALGGGPHRRAVHLQWPALRGRIHAGGGTPCRMTGFWTRCGWGMWACPPFLRLVGKYAKGLYWKYPQWIDAYHGREVSFSARAPITVVVDGEVMEDTRFNRPPVRKTGELFLPGRSVLPAGKASELALATFVCEQRVNSPPPDLKFFEIGG